DWIADGAAPPSDADPRVEGLEILPGNSLQRVGDAQQIVVRARYSDGRVEDVTPRVKWSSSDESVCRVDDAGLATMNGAGEGAVVAWYASRIAIARVTVPYNDGDPAAGVGRRADRRKPRNFVDDHVDRQLARLNLPASEPCDDAQFVRRAYL